MKTQLTVFLIEDEEHLVSLYEHALQSIATVHTAATADEAITKLDDLPAPPDVILLDLLIPEHKRVSVDFGERQGFQVLEYIRASSTLKQVPVLVMTNLDAAEDRRKADTLGAVDYIVKSNVVPRQIVQSIKATLQ